MSWLGDSILLTDLFLKPQSFFVDDICKTGVSLRKIFLDISCCLAAWRPYRCLSWLFFSDIPLG